MFSIKFSIKEILTIVEGNLLQGKTTEKINSISTDTRTLKKGGLFIALEGPHFNGHDFLVDAAKRGAKGALIHRLACSVEQTPQLPSTFCMILVKDTLKSFHAIARAHRLRHRTHVIGITGSAGKTTTKELIASVLAEKAPVLKNYRNYNNEIGVPLTLLALTAKHRFAAVEMGAQKPGDMDLLSHTVSPQIAVITNIGLSHMAFFTSEQAIAEEKAAILNGMPRGGLLLANADDPYFPFLKKQAKRHGVAVISFGCSPQADYAVSSSWHRGNHLFCTIGKTTYTLPLPGEHTIYNALPAIILGKHFKLSDRAIQKGLNRFHPTPHRMKVIKGKQGYYVIDDTYNASPHAMKAALLTLHQIAHPKGRKIAVLGDMLELGTFEEKAHQAIGTFLSQFPIDILITTGKRAHQIGAMVKVKGIDTQVHTKSKPQLLPLLKRLLKPHDTVLFKASRGIQLDEVVTALIHESKL